MMGQIQEFCANAHANCKTGVFFCLGVLLQMSPIRICHGLETFEPGAFDFLGVLRSTQEFMWYLRRTRAFLETLGIRTLVPASFIRLRTEIPARKVKTR